MLLHMNRPQGYTAKEVADIRSSYTIINGQQYHQLSLRSSEVPSHFVKKSVKGNQSDSIFRKR
jgi:hypothetical protein